VEPIRILLAEDYPVLRQGIKIIIEGNKEFLVVAEAGDGYSMIEKYFEYKPDIVLCDIAMPRLGGIEAAKEIIAKDNKAKIIFLTIHFEAELIYWSLVNGIAGFVDKACITGELFEAITDVYNGKKYYHKKTDIELEEIVKRFSPENGSECAVTPDMFTEREKEILAFIVKGLNSEEIGNLLFISKRTVENTIAGLMMKCKVKKQTALVRIALKLAALEVKERNY